MGWFWAASSPSSQVAPQVAPHPMPPPGSNATPPPSCPMHKKDAAAIPPTQNATPSSACPYPLPSATKPEASTSSPSYVSKLNPLNYMPTNLSNKRESEHQTVHLPQDREASTIPRGDGSGMWEYPSPQQMYNAMLRKGYTDTPAEHVEAMVAVHNFLNEGAWDEIRGWEQRFSNGLYRGWEVCVKGEEGGSRQMMLEQLQRARTGDAVFEPKLLRFEGRPNEPTPKARLMGTLAWLVPSQFPNNPPFDRHDWYVQRQLANGQSREVRYVIDYYSGPPEPTGEPVFYLDVRPALDGPTAACERMLRWSGDVWHKASGASVREEMARQRK